ncbi:MAG TPA: hypothetical protein VGK16_09560 [Candidatus Limnocylindrales bacterium]|jgi:hypothetical protein
MASRPVLILNPRDDATFTGYATELVNAADLTHDDLQRQLRERYPLASVRPRDLSSERTTVWYVYRDGHWVPRA